MRKRDVSLDILKGVLIVLVVLGHSIQINLEFTSNLVWNFIYSFHMPLFIMISGYLTKEESLTFYGVKRRFNQLMIPYIVWSLFLVIISSNRLQKIEDIVLHPDNSYWFLYVLFINFCILAIVKKISKLLNINKVQLYLMVAILLCVIMVLTEFRLFGFQFICWYFIFFLLGHLYRSYESKLKYIVTYAVFLFPLFILGGVTCKQKSVPDFLMMIPLPVGVMMYMYRFAVAIIAILFLFPVFKRYFSNVNSKFWIFISDLGKKSLGIYIIHLFIYNLLKPFFGQFINNLYLLVFLGFFFSLFISYFATIILMKNNITSKYLLGK